MICPHGSVRHGPRGGEAPVQTAALLLSMSVHNQVMAFKNKKTQTLPGFSEESVFMMRR